MVGTRTLRFTAVAVILVASQAIAEERCSFEFDEAPVAPSPSTLRTSPSGRQVRIYRGQVPLVAQAPAPLGSSAAIARDAEADTDTGPSLHTKPTGKVVPEEVRSPFVDDDAPHSECAACNQGGEFGACNPCGQCGRGGGCCGCLPFWAHSDSVFGESLFLKPRGTDMVHATQLNGDFQPGGSVGVVDPIFNTGFRVGFTKALQECASVVFTYSNFHSHAANTIEAPRDGNLVSTVVMPGTQAFNSTSPLLTAGYDVDFQLFDIDYRRLLSYGPCHDLNFNIGFRYANLQQNFDQIGDFTQPGDVNRTTSGIRFEGTGLKTGFDGERRVRNSQFTVYGKGFISVLFGQFHADYTQFNQTTSTVEASNRWNSDRAVPILEFEVGIRWISSNGRWRSSTGYYTAYWFNTITTPQYIQAVQTADFVNLGQTLTFDGIVSRLEYCF